jgi:LacI family transcriptional regulator
LKNVVKRPTQKDVAEQAGVSRSTVSYVLNDIVDQKIPISAETRQRVMDAIVTLGYEPDTRAQSLRSGNTKTFGVLFPDLKNPYYIEMLTGIGNEAQNVGYSLHLSQSFDNPENEGQSFRELVKHQVDGFILLTSFELLPTNTLKHIHKSGRPIVAITSIGSEFDHVLNGYGAGTSSLMHHLIDLGHRRIGFVYGVSRDTLGYDRLSVYYEVLKECHIQIDDTLIQRCGYTLEDGYQAARQLLSRPDRPTALLVINDYLAIGAMRAAADMGLRVPDDLSIASFDNLLLGQYVVPRITTVSTFPEQNGRDVVRLLLNRIANPDQPRKVIESGSQVFFRESTGTAPILKN